MRVVRDAFDQEPRAAPGEECNGDVFKPGLIYQCPQRRMEHPGEETSLEASEYFLYASEGWRKYLMLL